MNVEPSAPPTTTPDTGSGIVMRGLVLLALLIVVLTGGYFLIFRQPKQTPPPALLEPEPLISMLISSQQGYPGSISWGALLALADNLPSQPGWEIRYTTASSAARRGSPTVQWDVMRELLDEGQQFRNFRFRLHDGRLVPDEAAARRIMLSGLQAVAEWHDKQDKTKVQVTDALKGVYAAVDKLAQSPIIEVRIQAERTRAKLVR